MTFTKPNVIALFPEIEDALKAIGEKHGITFKINGGNFNPLSATLKLNLASGTGELATKEAAHFQLTAPSYGLKTTDLGRFVNLEWHEHGVTTVWRAKIIGSRTHRRSGFMVICQFDDGGKYLYRPSEVLTRLKTALLVTQ